MKARQAVSSRSLRTFTGGRAIRHSPGRPPRCAEVPSAYLALIREVARGARSWYRLRTSLASRLPLDSTRRGTAAAGRTTALGRKETCVIWGEDPDTRQSLGAGTPGIPDPSLQGTAASAAVPLSLRETRRGTRRDGAPHR